MVIAIDGPGGVGKTTVSRLVAERLGWPALDTGALYRAVTLAVLRAGVDPDDGRAITELLPSLAVGFEEGAVFLDGEDVSDSVRAPHVTEAVSAVSARAEVRRSLVPLQRRWVEEHGGSAVVEGRDIGTVVFPDAEVKVFLTARPEVRAARRARQQGSGLGETAADLAQRDRADSTRGSSPLRPAEDAVQIETSELTAQEVADRVLALAR